MNIGLVQNPFRIPVPHLHVLQVVSAFRDHAQVGVKRYAHRRIEGNLKRGAHALRAHGRDQLLANHHLRAFANQRFPFVGLLLRLTIGQHFRFLLGNGILSGE